METPSNPENTFTTGHLFKVVVLSICGILLIIEIAVTYRFIRDQHSFMKNQEVYRSKLKVWFLGLIIVFLMFSMGLFALYWLDVMADIGIKKDGKEVVSLLRRALQQSGYLLLSIVCRQMEVARIKFQARFETFIQMIDELREHTRKLEKRCYRWW